MSKKYLYKVTLSSGVSILGYSTGISLYYEVGKTYTPLVPRSKLIGFNTKREAIKFIITRWSLDYRLRLFRCEKLAPVTKINHLVNNYFDDYITKWWQTKRFSDRWDSIFFHDEAAPKGTIGCDKIKVLAELKY